MDKMETLQMLEAVKNGEMTTSEAVKKLTMAPFEDLGFAKIDMHRGLRQGIPEVIFGQGKTPEQIEEIVQLMLKRGESDILITRMSKEAALVVAKVGEFEYFDISRTGIVNRKKDKVHTGSVVIVSAGTSDMYVAEEAALTAEFLGSDVTRIYDAGVAGLHRLLAHIDVLTSARVIVAVAGMEGALASVVGGLVSCPVVAVPTSVGYGASFGGIAALLSMLNSCSSGVSVVNIDNGFGAGYLAHMINSMEGVE